MITAGPAAWAKRSRRTRTKDGERCFETRGRLQLSVQTTPWRAGSPQALTDRGLYNNQGGEALNICGACTSKTDGKGNANGFPMGVDRYPQQCLLDDLCIVLLLSESVGLAQASRAAAGHWCFMTGRDTSVVCYMMGRNRTLALSRQLQRRGCGIAGTGGDRSRKGPLSAQIPPPY